ncbi:hypothetical protein [Enterococcus hirae]|nr:hypothetical protein [Enterococcus hirae]
MEAKFITGVESLAKWDEYVSTLKSMGLNDFVSTYQKAYDRWAKTE